MRKAIFIIVLIFLPGLIPASNFTLTKGYQQAYQEVLRLRFGLAYKLIEQEKKTDPHNKAYVYLINYMDFLKVIISEDEKSYDMLLKNKAARIKQLEMVSKKSPWQTYSLAMINLQSGISRVKFGDYANAALDVNKAYRQFSSNRKLFPNFKPNKAGLGLMHVLVGSIPDSYKWVTGILGMEGDVDGGLQELQSLLIEPSKDDPYPFLYTESLFITTFITFNLADNTSNRQIIYETLQSDKLKEELKINPLIIYGISSFYLDQGKNDAALTLLQDRPTGKSYYDFRYLDYLTGLAMLNKLDPNARVYFLRFVTMFKGRNFIKSAYQRLAWSHLIEGDKAEYSKYLSRVLILGHLDIDSDKEAQKEAKRNKTPHEELLKARLLFDGGYYTKAEGILASVNQESLTEHENLELLYRKARIHHSSGEIEKAKVEYMQAYHKGKNSTTYFAANSLINLASIHEKEGNNKQALWCYKTALTLEFDDYKTSINQKAKAGINRVGKS